MLEISRISRVIVPGALMIASLLMFSDDMDRVPWLWAFLFVALAVRYAFALKNKFNWRERAGEAFVYLLFAAIIVLH